MKRKMILGAVLATLFLTATAGASEPISIVVNGTYINTDTAPVITPEGRTIVPLRVISESMGAEVRWDGDNKAVSVFKDGSLIEFNIGEDMIYKDGMPIKTDSPAQIINGRTMVPLRVVSESMGCLVEWDGETKTVNVSFDAEEGISDDAIKENLPEYFEFSSGAGGWGTIMVLSNDGSFSGSYHDSDMGDTGEGYPNGTFYGSSFTGQFCDIEKNGDAYTMMLGPIYSDYEPDKTTITDGVRYISSFPYGLESGTKFVLYTPDTPLSGLDEEFLTWWAGRYDSEKHTTLDCYGLWNVDTGYGFFGYVSD